MVTDGLQLLAADGAPPFGVRLSLGAKRRLLQLPAGEERQHGKHRSCSPAAGEYLLSCEGDQEKIARKSVRF